MGVGQITDREFAEQAADRKFSQADNREQRPRHLTVVRDGGFDLAVGLRHRVHASCCTWRPDNGRLGEAVRRARPGRSHLARELPAWALLHGYGEAGEGDDLRARVRAVRTRTPTSRSCEPSCAGYLTRTPDALDSPLAATRKATRAALEVPAFLPRSAFEGKVHWICEHVMSLAVLHPIRRARGQGRRTGD